MVSKKSWEKFKRDVEGLTKTGVERESWGKRLANKDLNESLSWKQRKSALAEHSFEACGDSDNDDIKGFSSSGEDEPKAICEPVKTFSSGLKRRSLSRSVPAKKRRLKKYDEPDASVSSPVTGFRGTFSHWDSAKKKSCGVDGWKNVSCDFENSFTAVSPSLGMTVENKTFEGESEPLESEDIAWSDSDSEEMKFSAHVETPGFSSTIKTPISPRHNNSNNEAGKLKILGDIEDFDSENEVREPSTENSDKVSSPSISPNTPTPTPTSPKVGEVEGRPPLDSAKKRKQKYSRSGLAEKLRKLLMRQNSEKSFWLHKIRQLREEHSSGRADGTVTLRVISDDLDHSVHVIKCDVISQDVISGRQLPGNVIVLLDNETRKQLEFKSKPSYLRIYSPWKIFDLPNSSLSVLLCITHCEVVSDVPMHMETISATTVGAPASSNTKQVHQGLTKVVRTELFPPTDGDGKPTEEWSSTDFGDANQAKIGNGDSTEQTSWDNLTPSCSILDAIGLQGQCEKTRIHFTARIQRIYWRNVGERDRFLPSASSLLLSIIESSKNLQEPNSTSMCLLVQDSTGFCSEVQISSAILLSRTDWQERFCGVVGSVVSFRGVQLRDHWKRRRKLGVFDLIDSLSDLYDKSKNTKDKSSKHSKRQKVCFIFSIDEGTLLERLNEDEEVKDSSPYLPPKSLAPDALQFDLTFHLKRVKLCGKLLHVTFKNDQHHNTNQVRLFISGIMITDKSPMSDTLGESEEAVSDSIIQVFHRDVSTVGWNESTLVTGQLLYVHDLVVEKDNPTTLSADVFSSIHVLISQSTFSAISNTPVFHRDDLWRKIMSIPIDNERYSRLKLLPHTVLPQLNLETQSDILVAFEGIIIDVDQANAFCWFTCNECGSDDISELPDSSLYICNSCGLDIHSPVTNTHLEVYLKSTRSPPVYVKAKLLQSTISRLLPVKEASSHELSQGYDVQCVLNKHVGPMSCYILEKFYGKDSDEDAKISFKLEELDTSSWTQ